MTRKPKQRDRRRRLTSRDYLLIKLAAESHSISQLAQIFKISRSYARRIILSPSLRCLACHGSKPLSSGELVALKRNPKAVAWICGDCARFEFG